MSSAAATRALVAILVLFSAALTLRFLVYALSLLAYPEQWEAREALSLHHALLVAQGEPLYRVRESPPIVVPPYGPVYPWGVAPLVNVWPGSLFPARLVSFVSFVVLVGGVALVVRKLTGRWTWAVIALGLALLKIHWWCWLLLGRPDALGTLLLYVALFVHWRNPRSRLALRVTALLLLLAFFTKVYFLLGAASVFLNCLLLQKDAKRALGFLAAQFVTLLLALGAIQWWTGGLYTLFTFQMMHHYTPYSLSQMLRPTAALGASYLSLWLAMAWDVIDGRADFRRDGVLWSHLIVAIPAVAFLLTNPGGSAYYWFVVVPAAIVLGCDRLAAEAARPDSRRAVPALALTALSMLATQGFSVIYPSAALAAQWEPLRQRFATAKGPIMNNDATALWHIQAGRELYSEGGGFAPYAQFLQERFGYRFVDIAGRIRARYYALIVNPEDRRGVERDYVLAHSYEVPLQLGRPIRMDVYEPKGGPPVP